MGGHQAQAEALFRQVLAQQPTHGLAASNLGTLLIEQHRYDEGWAWVVRATQHRPDHPGVWVNLGNAYLAQGKQVEAVRAYRSALDIDPANPAAWRNQTRLRMEIIDWDGIDAYLAHVRSLQTPHAASPWADYVSPFDALFLPFSRAELLHIARHEAARFAAPRVARSNLNGAGRPLRLAYLSADFHDHPTMHLAGRLFELHDRRRFEVFAYNVGYPDDSPWRRRARAGCDWFVDAHLMDDSTLAQRIATDQIEVLVDLKGWTGGGRPGVFARACAPVQVSYLGMPGSTGMPAIGHVIADHADRRRRRSGLQRTRLAPARHLPTQ
jgi:protein O-GlcNAc transferase